MKSPILLQKIKDIICQQCVKRDCGINLKLIRLKEKMMAVMAV